MIRFDQHGVFEVTSPDLLRHVGGSGPLPDLPNVGCSGYGTDLACFNQYCPNQVCANVVCPPYDNVACGFNNVSC
jgi:hypothetical protein